MKFTLVLLLCAAGAAAADFTNAQAARLVIGQPSFTVEDPAPTDIVLGSAAGVAYAANTLFVADSNMLMATPLANRVLIYNNVSSQIPAPTDPLAQNSLCPACVGKANVVLGQPDFTTLARSITQSAGTLLTPTAVASDGVRLVVADTGNNRVLIWNHIPTSNRTPADVVVGQPNFTTITVPANHGVSASSLLGPEGVWIQNGRLYIADTLNNRVLIYNRIPTSNGAAADLVLGQSDFTTFKQIALSEQSTAATATNMLTPVSVTTDGTRLFVTDLGFNRVLVWNTLPTSNGAAANFALGQPNLTTSVANNAYTVDSDNNYKETPVLCSESIGVDSNDSPIYSPVCAATMSFPRFALFAGGRLFVADGGNDRIMVYQTMPTASGAAADLILGEPNAKTSVGSNAADSLRTPMSLAWDGTNLYVADLFNRRILVYSVGETFIPVAGVRNGASFAVYSTGSVQVTGAIKAGDVVTIKISKTVNNIITSTTYSYTIQASDTIKDIIDRLVEKINLVNDDRDGDPFVVATADYASSAVHLTAREQGEDGDSVAYTSEVSSGASIQVLGGGTTLSGGADASKIAPGTLVSIFARRSCGDSETSVSWDSSSCSSAAVLSYAPPQLADLSKTQLPTELGGVQVYINGFQAPLMYVSPAQINTQIPWEMAATTSVNVYVRIAKPDGSVVATTPVAVTIIPANPGLFTYDSPLREAPVIAQHASSHAMGIVSVDGSTSAGDGGVISIRGRRYEYTVLPNDTLVTVSHAFVDMINARDPEVYAAVSGQFTRIMLFARIEGPGGNDIPFSAGVTVAPTASGGALVLTPFSAKLCCANLQGALVTARNPAVADEFIYVYATGIGEAHYTPEAAAIYKTGAMFPLDSPVTSPKSSVSAAIARVTADVLEVTPMPGAFGVFRVLLHINAGVTGNLTTFATLAQDGILSNVTTLPVLNPTFEIAQ